MKIPSTTKRAPLADVRRARQQLRDGYAGPRGLTIIQKVENLLDQAIIRNTEDHYVYGLSDALALLRSSSRAHELERALERLKIDPIERNYDVDPIEPGV